jgi:hypothetical protein
VCDKRAKGHKGSVSFCTEEVAAATQETVIRSTRKRVRHIAQQIEVLTSTAWKICRNDFSMSPHNTELSQLLPEDGIRRPNAIAREFEALLEDNPGILNVTWFSDGPHPHLDVSVNKQNIRFWTLESPRLTVTKPFHPSGYISVTIKSPNCIQRFMKNSYTLF